jgi:hypothetical protein
MDNEPEVTSAHMDETRASLSEKLETLEHHVVDTVQGATSAVAETVANVKVAVAETVENVKDTMNLHLQVQRHPWGMVGGSIALGYLGYLLFRKSSAQPTATRWSQPPPSASLRITRQQNGVVRGHHVVEEAAAVAQAPSEPAWLSGLTDQFGPEITKLKGLAIGTALSVVRDLITESVSEQMKPQLADVMDSITAKLGGEPIRGRMSKDGPSLRPQLVRNGAAAGMA